MLKSSPSLPGFGLDSDQWKLCSLCVLHVCLLCSDALLLSAQSLVLLLQFLVAVLQCVSPLQTVDQ